MKRFIEGVVVAGEMGAGATREEMAIVGETPNVAARLEGLAEPGSVLISESTHSLMAVFGAPVAHDDDPLRAVRAAFDIQQRMSDLSSEVGHVVQVHIGIPR
jgi:class 3 adenylate cyclase